MSEYADIMIKNLSLASFRNYLDNEIVSLFFSSEDLVITPNCKIDLENDESDGHTQYVYRTTVEKAKQRLDVCGFSIANFEKIFNANMFQAVCYDDFLFHLKVDCDHFEEESQKRIENRVTFTKWKNAMHKIVSYELEKGNLRWLDSLAEINIRTECDKIIFYSLSNIDAESFYGINTRFIDVAYIFRMILESCDCDEEIELDFSRLQYWAEDCIPRALVAVGNTEKTIVLVEGTSDKDILEFSMKQIYPHLSDLFYFMDFELENVKKRKGGVDTIANNLKAFVYSKIKAKFIAIFDNDAVGKQAAKKLVYEIGKLPDNFRVLNYPNIKRAQKYPTIGVNGKLVLDNVNERACSIELYLPEFILKIDNMYPFVEWESRVTVKLGNQELQAYQGVVSEKVAIQKRFTQYKKSMVKGKCTFNESEWIDMKSLLDEIINSFS